MVNEVHAPKGRSSQPLHPTFRATASMGDSPDCDYLFLLRIDDGKWKLPQQESAGFVASKTANVLALFGLPLQRD